MVELKHKNLTKATVLLSSMMTLMAGAIISPALPSITEAFKDVSNAKLLTQMLVTMPALFIAIVAPLAGWYIDKFGRKKLLMSCYLLYAISGTSGYFCTDLYSLLVGRVFLGIAVGGIMTTTTTLVGDYFQDEERVAFMGMQSAFISLGGVVFISMAGVLADKHWQAPFLIYLFSIVVFLMAIPYLVEPRRNELERSKSSEQLPALSAEDVSYRRFPIYFIYCMAFISVVIFYMVPIQMPYVLKAIGVSGSLIGVAMSTQTLASVVISSNYHRFKARASFPTIYAISFILMAIGYLIVAGGSSLWHYILGFVISGLGVGFFMPSTNLWAMSLVPPAIRGKIVGRVSAAIFIGMFFCPIIVQPVAEKFSPSVACAAAAGVMGVLFTLVLVLKSKLH